MYTVDTPGHKLIARRNITNDTFVLTFERHGIDFVPGQYLIVGKKGHIHRREYSIYSARQDTHLEILLKEVPNGLVSSMLHTMPIGEILEVEGPFGYFTLSTEAAQAKNIMIATGTGIAPFHSLAQSYPVLDYVIAHGVPTPHHCYEHTHYAKERYLACTSRESGEGWPGRSWNGRVTTWLPTQEIDAHNYYWLCGNSDMIYQIHDILMAHAVDPSHIMAEVYF